MRPELTTLLVAPLVGGIFSLVPLIVQIVSTRAQRRDRMARLNHLRAELELLERLHTLQGKVNATDDATRPQTNLYISDALSKLVKQYNALSEIAPSDVGGGKRPSPRQLSFLRRALLLYYPYTTSGWILHTLFYFLSLTAGGLYIASLIVSLAFYSDDPRIGRYIVAGLIIGFSLLVIQRLARRNATRSAAQLEKPNA
jgi:hypothetical protein